VAIKKRTRKVVYMSYWCHATNVIVQGETREMVPVKIRKVIYVGQTAPAKRSQYLQFAGQSEGWEVVEEVSVRRSKAEEFKAAFPPIVVGEKEVRFIKPRKAKEKFIRREDEDDDKGED